MALLDEQGETPGNDPAPPRKSPGWLRWLLLALWVPLLLVSLAAPVMQTVGAVTDDSLRMSPFERVGLFAIYPDILKPFSEEARQSGLRRGDTFLAVDGRPLADGGTAGPSPELGMLLLGPEGSTVLVTARSQDGTVRQHRLTRTTAHAVTYFRAAGVSYRALDWLGYLTNLLGNGVVIAASLLLFVKGGARAVPKLLAFALLFVGLTYFAGIGVFAPDKVDVLALMSLTLGWSLLIVALMLFPNGRFDPPWMRWLALMTIPVTPIGMFQLLPIFLVAPVHTLLLAAAVASLIARYRHLPPGTERQQIRWAMLGFAVGLLALTVRLILQLGIMPSDVTPTVYVSAIIADTILNAVVLGAIAGGLLISLLRYRLYDAERVIARSASFGVLALLLVALFAGTEKVIELLGEEYLGEQLGVLAGGIGAAVAALMIVPLHHRLSRWAERRFQKQLIRLKRDLPLMMGDLRETAPVERIAAAALDSVIAGVRASRAALVMDKTLVEARGIAADEVERWRVGWLPAAHDGFDIDRSDPAFPLRVPLEADGHGRIGWLLLGPRPDGSFYGKDEREALAEIADPVARALEIAQRREAREAAELERWRGQESLNAELKTVNSELVRILGSLDEKLGQLVSPPIADATQDAPPRRRPPRRASGTA